MAFDRLRGGLRLEDAIPFLAESIGEGPANQFFVVNDEDGRRTHDA
jgi:hypothetical protein